MRPNILVVGAGHSGTRVIPLMLAKLGWHTGILDEFGEDPRLWQLNDKPHFDKKAVQKYIDRLAEPWVIKDTRLCGKLAEGWPTLNLGNLFVLHISRDTNAIMRSHARRNEVISQIDVVQKQQKIQQFFNQFNGPKLSITFEQLTAAVAIFDVSRAKSS